MIDFLRANPWCSQEEYKWRMTVPQIRLASFDFSHVEYRGKDNGITVEDTISIDSGEELDNLTDLGIPVL